ncbi:hypothetical protein LINPERPRIM_LOCUS35136 [Linum perenne]
MSSSYTKSSVSFDGAGSFSSTGYNLEYRSLTDDAWYTVCAIFDGKSLTVKYQGFQDDEDDLFEPHRFISLDEIEELKSRFRPVSHQLQDCECLGLTRGTAVCVSHSFDGNDNIFFDATIDEVGAVSLVFSSFLIALILRKRILCQFFFFFRICSWWECE